MKEVVNASLYMSYFWKDWSDRTKTKPPKHGYSTEKWVWLNMEDIYKTYTDSEKAWMYLRWCLAVRWSKGALASVSHTVSWGKLSIVEEWGNTGASALNVIISKYWELHSGTQGSILGHIEVINHCKGPLMRAPSVKEICVWGEPWVHIQIVHWLGNYCHDLFT